MSRRNSPAAKAARRAERDADHNLPPAVYHFPVGLNSFPAHFVRDWAIVREQKIGKTLHRWVVRREDKTGSS